MYLGDMYMKKVIGLLLVVLFLTGCEDEKIDYSNYLFTDVNWIRNTEYDTENIRFKSDGRFSYFCGCGNPVNDADLCESYTYDEKTNEIKLDCFETTEETVETIKIIEMTEEMLRLDFNGEIREFIKEK